ncbi:MAG TPA: hypothetical protein VEI06_06985 [Gemmatimonadaceae bacterium]|nr:hypothetical protein [Gemmatimonadaceae bacterium]
MSAPADRVSSSSGATLAHVTVTAGAPTAGLPPTPLVRLSLLARSRLVLDIDPGYAAAFREILPPPVEAGHAQPAAHVRVARDAGALVPPEAPGRPPVLRLGRVGLWTSAAGAPYALLRSDNGRVSGTLELESRRSRISIAERAGDLRDAVSAFSIAVPLLLGRLGHVLVHAGAVIAPDGTAFLVVGDSRSGKSSTIATLIAGGWDYLSDDQLVLSPGPDGDTVVVEGWRSTFHLDAGWKDRVVTGDRVSVDPTTLGAGRWRRTAVLGGLLLSQVVDDSTHLRALGSADAFAAVVRQSPWVMADRVVAPHLVSLLRRVAAMPAARLILGEDSYAHPERLIPIVRAALGS